MKAMTKTTSNESFAFANRFDQQYQSVASWITPNGTVELSFVIVTQNNKQFLRKIISNIEEIAGNRSFEIVIVDDGSTDKSWIVIQALADLHYAIRGLRFRCPQGRSASLQAGLSVAQGELIFTLPGEAHEDLKQAPLFIEKINEGFDLVSSRKQPAEQSRAKTLYNVLLSRVMKIALPDHDGSFVCYRREVAKSIKLFGELHRMVPSLAKLKGFKVTAIDLDDRSPKTSPPIHGVRRFVRGFSDLLKLNLLQSYHEQPSKYANFCAAGSVFTVACLIASVILVGIQQGGGVVSTLAALFFFGMGGACAIAGLFCELMLRQNSPAQVSRIDFDTNEPELIFNREEDVFFQRAVMGLMQVPA